MNKEINREIGWSIVMSVAMIVAGVLAVIVPPASGIAVTVLVGWLMMFYGAVQITYGWQDRGGGGLVWGVLLGILYGFTGGYMLMNPVAGLASLTLVLAACLFIESILEVILSFKLRPLSGSGWLLLHGIITLILAIMIWRSWPTSTMWVIGTLVGISMVFSGIARLMISLGARRLASAFSQEVQEPAPGH
jgi:uncharacterized membrane protein HdeD (DUF308 family)